MFGKLSEVAKKRNVQRKMILARDKICDIMWDEKFQLEEWNTVVIFQKSSWLQPLMHL